MERKLAANLGAGLKKQLPAPLLAFLRRAGEIAEEQQQRLYLVGGVVRDVLLVRNNTDLDLVLAGDATALADKLAEIKPGKLTVHRHFGTATLEWEGGSADLVTARAETYSRPGALPDVRSGTIADDLARRDFTVNAMAIELNPRHYGELLDPFGGVKDLENAFIRVLHDKSFIDDATRIWRALRYEQRLNFSIEPETLKLLERDIEYLETISGDRIRHELELVLCETEPEKALQRAAGLGVLSMLHPSLKFNARQAGWFVRARLTSRPQSTREHLYLALLCYNLNNEEIEQLITYLHLPGAVSRVLRDTTTIRGKLDELSSHGLAPSRIHALLHGYAHVAYEAISIAAGGAAAEHIELFLSVLCHINPVLSGDDIKKLGVPEGPQIHETIQKLREARLDGKLHSHRDEEDMVRVLMKEAKG